METQNKKKKLFDKWMNFATGLNIDRQKKLLEMLPQFWGNKSDDLKVKKKAINHIMNIFSSPTSNADCPSVHDVSATVDLTSDCETKDAETTGDATKDPAEATGDATKDAAEATVSTTKDPVEANGDAIKNAEATGSTTKDPAEATANTRNLHVLAYAAHTTEPASTLKNPLTNTQTIKTTPSIVLAAAAQTTGPASTLKNPLTNTQAIKTTTSSNRQQKTRKSKRLEALRAKEQSNNNSTRSDQQLIQSGQQDKRRSRVNHKRAKKAALEDKSTEIINRTEYLKSQANSLNGDPNAIFLLLLERHNLKSELARADSCPWVREMYVEQTLHDNILRFVEDIDDDRFASKSDKYDDGFDTESWYDFDDEQKEVCYYYASLEYIITYCIVFVNIIQ